MTVRGWVFTVGSGAVAILAGLAVGGYFHLHRTPRLTEKDTIVVADFDNTTGDPVFDSTLRQGLSVQLEQSPFLSLLSEARVQQTLRQMGQPAGAPLRPGIAREVCRRTGSTAVIDGSIARLGNQYVIGLKALECRGGPTRPEEESRLTATGLQKVRLLVSLNRKALPIRSA
jgi:hypothetical protein